MIVTMQHEEKQEKHLQSYLLGFPLDNTYVKPGLYLPRGRNRVIRLNERNAEQ